MAHMTAHFRGGPLDGQSRYNNCEKTHGHTIAVQDSLSHADFVNGYYQVENEPLCAEVMGEFLVDIVYVWVESE